MPTTSGRSRGRQGVHSGARGAAGDHTRVIMATMVATAIIIIFVLVMTTAGRTIDAATQHFMLFYAGVFALIGLTGSVLVGLVATDRIVMTPGHRVMAQAVHRAMSFGALTFLIIHIVTEILAQRVHVIDAFIPFLSPFRTFYIGLGTIASDLIILIVVTSILRKRFTAHGKAWRWRAIHYSSYAAFVLGVLHGLLGGRAAKPYVDWSYGFAIALTALGLAVRFLAISLRPKENVGAAPGADRARSTSSEPLQAAALSLAQAQLGGPVQVLPAGMAVGSATTGMRNSDSWPALPAASGWSSASGPIPALGPAPAYAAADASTGAYLSYPADPSADPYRSPDPYRELGFAPLGAPPYNDDRAATLRGRPYVAMDSPMEAQAGPSGATGPGSVTRQPLYEPGYDGPPRFAGAPRGHVPQDELSSYPYGVPGNRPSGAGYPDREEPGRRSRPRHQRAIEPSDPGPANSGQTRQGQGDRNTGSIPRPGTGPVPRPDTGPIPRIGTGQLPRGGTGPMPWAGTGPMPRADSGPIPRAGTGPMPRAGTGPMSRPGTGPMPQADSGSMSRADSGPMPRAAKGPMPRQDTGPIRRAGTGPMPRVNSGPMPWVGTGPMPRPEAGPASRSDTGPIPHAGGPRLRTGTGPAPRAGRGQGPRAGTDPTPSAGPGSMPRPDTSPMSRPDTGPIPRVGAGPVPRAGTVSMPSGARAPLPGAGKGPVARPDTGPIPRVGSGPAARMGPGPGSRSDTGPTQPAGTGAMPRAGSQTPPADPDPAPRGGPASGATGRRSRRTDSADPGYREVSRPTGSDEWR